jgi:hypothetical protein
MNLRLPIVNSRLPALAGLLAMLLAVLASGCATSRERCPVAVRAFNFRTDTFAYSNQLTWTYSFDAAGKMTTSKRVPPPDYALHCFVMTRAAERLFFNARFDASLPTTDLAIYRRLVHAALRGGTAQAIPGYASLREFSAAQEALLKEACGGAWRSYLQRGNWRLVFPITRAQQAKLATELAKALRGGQLPIVHLARFPQQTINHAVLLVAARETEAEIVFTAYDPNLPDAPVELTYDRAAKTFNWPRSHYFGGAVIS